MTGHRSAQGLRPQTTPVTVLTGFLGSGKTTLLNRLLRREGMARCAVLVNELGEIPLDHLIVREMRDDLVVLDGGCICCSSHGDLIRALDELHALKTRGEIQPFERVLIETTGLADPAPILFTLARHPRISRMYHHAALVTAVAADLGMRTLDRHPEARKQVVLADRVIVTKTDVARGSQVQLLERRLQRLNPGAEVVRGARGEVPAEAFVSSPLTDLQREILLRTWLDMYRACDRDDQDGADGHHAHGQAREPAHADVEPELHSGSLEHGDGVASVSVALDRPVSYSLFSLWLSLLAQIHGDHLLRVKGCCGWRARSAP